MAVTALPPPLARTVADEAARVPVGDLVQAAQSLSLAYRRERGVVPPALNDALRAAYLTVRLPATFAAASTALAELSYVTDPSPFGSCLDVGAGPGTASLAALNLWPTLSVHQLER